MKFTPDLREVVIWPFKVKNDLIEFRYSNSLTRYVHVGDYVIHGKNSYRIITKMKIYRGLREMFNDYENPDKLSFDEFKTNFETENANQEITNMFIVIYYKMTKMHSICLPKFYEDNNIKVHKYFLNGAKTIELFKNNKKYSTIEKDHLLRINITRHSCDKDSAGEDIYMIFKVIRVTPYQNIEQFKSKKAIANFIPEHERLIKSVRISFKDYEIIAFHLQLVKKK